MSRFAGFAIDRPLVTGMWSSGGHADFFARAPAGIEQSARVQGGQHRVELVITFGLSIGPSRTAAGGALIVFQTEPLKIGVLTFEAAFRNGSGIEVFDSQNVPQAGFACGEVGQDRGSCVAQMKVTCRGGGETPRAVGMSGDVKCHCPDGGGVVCLMNLSGV